MTAIPVDFGLDVICTRCLTPARGWTWRGVTRCEPCHRHELGSDTVDGIILAEAGLFGEWWTDELLDRIATGPEAT